MDRKKEIIISCALIIVITLIGIVITFSGMHNKTTSFLWKTR